MVWRRLSAIVCCLSAVTTLAAQQAVLEYDVKAAFVLNFIRFVEWPAARRTPPLQICVLQPNPFADRLDNLVAGEEWHGGGIEVRVMPDLQRSTNCHVIYVPEAASGRFTSSVSVVSGLPILLVGEHQQFLEQGGMIRLFLENSRVRFSINQGSADAGGLLISSRLLRLAREVISPGSGL